MNGNLTPSFIRTFFPIFMGAVLTRYALDVDDPDFQVLVQGLVTGAYYGVGRFLEVFAGPKWGYVLGIAKAPGYLPGDPPKGAPVGEPDNL